MFARQWPGWSSSLDEKGPVKGNKEMVFKKVLHVFAKIKGNNKKLMVKFQGCRITGIKQLHFRAKKIFKGVEPSIYTKNANKSMTCAPSLTSSGKDVYCTSPSSV